MDLVIKKKLAEACGWKAFEAFGLNEKSWGYRDSAALDLRDLGEKRLAALEKLLAATAADGAKVLLGDIQRYRDAAADPAAGKPRTVRQFCDMLKQHLLGVPGRRVYRQDATGEQWLAYYVENVTYHPPNKGRDYTTPEYVDADLWYEEFGGKTSVSARWHYADCTRMSVAEALARRGIYSETKRFRDNYLAEVERWSALTGSVGLQLLASGVGTDDLDGNPGGRKSSWYWRQTNTVQMVRGGAPTRVVADVFYEDVSTDRKQKNGSPSATFWEHARRKRNPEDEDEDEEDLGEDFEPEPIEVPVHPYVPVFDMQKHLRLRVHVNYLEPYPYDEHLADKLVLRPALKDLVQMLIEHKGAAFRDVVKGKGGGVVVLLAGPPGVGKTLTAEVFAESEKRALYSVQCSQLGTKPDTLEDELLKVFARANRWNAVLLLDEADVYVHERGCDLDHNAIVGVFLRVLEYQDTVLFLTTNRPDDVDDAIASRCVARLNYQLPDPEEQARIWRVLADQAGVRITDKAVREVVEQNPDLSGRDVKNLLKLANLTAPGAQVTPAAVAHVRQFQPTLRPPK